MKPTTKFGEIEYAKRHDGKFAMYKYMADPTVGIEHAETFKRIDYTPGRWVQVDVLSQLPSSR